MSLPRLTFCADRHEYRLDGHILPSATQIIQRVMPYQGPRDEYAMQRGTATHHGCALDDMGKLDWVSVAPEIEGRILAWRNFRRDWPAGIVSIEQPMASDAMRFAGTPDRVFERDGKLVLADIKSTIVPQSIVQAGFYSLLLTENGTPVEGAVIVEVRDDETFKCEWLDSRELRRAERVAMACLTVFGFVEKNNLKGNQWQQR